MGAGSNGLNYAAKVLRIGSESLLPLNFANLKLYLSFCIVPELRICSSTQRATCLFCPEELKTHTREISGREAED